MDPDGDQRGPGCPAGLDDCPGDPGGWIYLTGYRDYDYDTYTLGSGETVCSPGTLPLPYLSNPSPVSDCNDFDQQLHHVLQVVPDTDGDGYGLGATVLACTGGSPPAQYVEYDPAAEQDCDDNDGTVFRALVGHEDKDDDGFTVGFPLNLCTDGALPVGYRAERSGLDDCNDNDRYAFPGQSAFFEAGMSNNGTLTHDYNCSYAHEYEFFHSCVDLPGYPGWGWNVSLSALPCGSTGTWINCSMQGSTSESRVARCH